jgi:hypothetical protein
MAPANREPDRSALPCRPPAAAAEAHLPCQLAALVEGPIEEALSRLSPAEEQQLARLLGKLQRHLEKMLAPADNGGDEDARRSSPPRARLEERS